MTETIPLDSNWIAANPPPVHGNGTTKNSHGRVLAIGGSPIIAAGWGVWLYGQSGRRVATTKGPIGFLAREVPAEFPRLLPQ